MNILKGDEAFAYKVGEIEGHRAIQGKSFAELNVLVVDAVDLIGNVQDGFFIDSHTISHILIVTSHQDSSHLVQFLHLGKVEAQRY